MDQNNALYEDLDRILVTREEIAAKVKELGLKEVPVVRADDLTDAQIKALRLADNKTNESGWDFMALEEELEKLSADFDMSDFGFTDTTDIYGLDDMFTEAPENEPEEPKQIKCPHCGMWFTP